MWPHHDFLCLPISLSEASHNLCRNASFVHFPSISQSSCYAFYMNIKFPVCVVTSSQLVMCIMLHFCTDFKDSLSILSQHHNTDSQQQKLTCFAIVSPTCVSLHGNLTQDSSASRNAGLSFLCIDSCLRLQ
jgi:hypothetical protein